MRRLPGILFLLGTLFILVLVIIYLPGRHDDYVAAMENERKVKDLYMKGDPASPFVSSEVPFKGLKYFDPDAGYRVMARITPLPSEETVQMKMNDGTFDLYIRYATAEFNLEGRQHKLTLYKPTDEIDGEFLFLPFYDETSAVTSYGGGRYLNPEFIGWNEIELDFNQAYNPYCAYVDGYTCPLPPVENHIMSKITAGERIYKSE